MKKILFILFLFLLVHTSEEESTSPKINKSSLSVSRRSTISGSKHTKTTVIAPTNRINRNLYTTQVIIVADGVPVYLTLQIESTVDTVKNKMEFRMKLWEVERLLTTKRVSVTW